MPIAFTCKHCGREYDLPDMAGGRKGKCECGAVLVVPSTPTGPSPAAASSDDEAAGEAGPLEETGPGDESGPAEAATEQGAPPNAAPATPSRKAPSIKDPPKKPPRTLGEAARMAAEKRKPAPKLEWPSEPTDPSESSLAAPTRAEATRPGPAGAEPPPLPPNAFGSGGGEPPAPPVMAAFAKPDAEPDDGSGVEPTPSGRILAGKYGKLREYCQRLSFVADLVFWLSLCTAVLVATVGAWVATHSEPYAIVGSAILAGLTLAVGYGVSLGMKALAQFFHVVMDIEENTRDTALKARRE